MLNSDLAKQFDAAGLPAPGILTRARFLGQRHPATSSILISLSLSVMGILVFALLPGIALESRARLMLSHCALNLGIACMLFTWLSTASRKAKAQDIAAALAAATDDERPHLVTQLQARLSSRIQTEPLSGSQLADIFNIVRSEHGRPARRREREVEDRRLLAKRLESLAGEFPKA